MNREIAYLQHGSSRNPPMMTEAVDLRRRPTSGRNGATQFEVRTQSGWRRVWLHDREYVAYENGHRTRVNLLGRA